MGSLARNGSRASGCHHLVLVGTRSVTPLRRRRKVLYPQLTSCDQSAVVRPFDFDEPDLLRPTDMDGRTGRPYRSSPMRTEEVGGVRHPDHGHAARSLVGSECGPVTPYGLDDRGPNTTVNDAVRLLVSFINVDISNDSRGCQFFDPEPQRTVPAWLRFHPMLSLLFRGMVGEAGSSPTLRLFLGEPGRLKGPTFRHPARNTALVGPCRHAMARPAFADVPLAGQQGEPVGRKPQRLHPFGMLRVLTCQVSDAFDRFPPGGPAPEAAEDSAGGIDRRAVAAYACAGLLLTVYAFTLIFRPSAGSGRLLTTDWSTPSRSQWLWLPGMCTRSASKPCRHRRPRSGTVGLGDGDVIWSLESSPNGPSLADGFYLAFYPLAYVALMSLIRNHARPHQAIVWLDGVIAGLGAAAVSAAFAFDTILRAIGGTTSTVAVNLAYPSVTSSCSHWQ